MSSVVRTRILIVTENPDTAAQTASALTTVGYGVLHAADSLQGLIVVEDERPALVLLDWGMPFIAGAVFLQALRAGLPQPPPVVVLAGPSADPAEIEAARPAAWLAAPLDLTLLVRTVQHVLGRP